MTPAYGGPVLAEGDDCLQTNIENDSECSLHMA